MVHVTIRYVHGQVLTFSLRALYRFGRAMAGTVHGETKEQVADHLDIMKRHIEFVQDCIEHPDFIVKTGTG